MSHRGSRFQKLQDRRCINQLSYCRSDLAKTMSSASKPSERLNLDSYNTIPIENWTCDKLVEHYHANLERKDWARVLDRIKKDIKIVADLDSVFNEEHRKVAQSIIDNWKVILLIR